MLSLTVCVFFFFCPHSTSLCPGFYFPSPPTTTCPTKCRQYFSNFRFPEKAKVQRRFALFRSCPESLNIELGRKCLAILEVSLTSRHQLFKLIYFLTITHSQLILYIEIKVNSIKSQLSIYKPNKNCTHK